MDVGRITFGPTSGLLRKSGSNPCAQHLDRPSVTWIKSEEGGMRTACQECKDISERAENILSAEVVE